MSTMSSLEVFVETYLLSQGWARAGTGSDGSMWVSAAGQTLAVPTDLRAGTLDWTSVLRRLSVAEKAPSDELAKRISRQFIDVAHLRAAKDIVIAGSIPLDAGVQLVSSAKMMLRASATTSRSVRARIGGNYSKVGDEIASQARLGHTEEGSYVIPVLMPLPAPDLPGDAAEEIPGLERVQPETSERRVMRTFAATLEAISEHLVEPATDPRQADLIPVIAAGGSREFLSAILRILESRSVAEFSAFFTWAPGLAPPSHGSEAVTVPSGASELLARAERLMKAAPARPRESISGPVVEVRHVLDDPGGSLVVQTIRNGRPAFVRVIVRESDVPNALDWMRSGRTVLVDGKVERVSGQGLRIDSPVRFGPIEDLFPIS